ncbi:ROK family transcriptional regulator [Sporosarcina aquimarina]|uniref:ROK family transcriptional regulator n=1 Tax=Sporosarcina aquimarina TaxID=114975 RepID=UPI0020402FBC|nr:ROK family transcriptional regulator [Sporosarcina aquimarina]MCM3756376.1 ROK family transcriptional regulator [Sporosarcina aquimarina]
MLNGSLGFLRNENKRKVLQRIIDEEQTTRVQISRDLLMSKPTVSSLVEELIEGGWIIETGSGEASSNGGRKPVNLRFNAKNAYCIGIDIGGTGVVLGITDLNGELVNFKEFETQKNLGEKLLIEIKSQVDEMLNESDIDSKDILGVGVGVPGITNLETGIVVEAPALKWSNYPAKKKIEEALSMSVFIDNDVNVSLLGEKWLGRGRQASNMIYISVGTGIGSGIMLQGNIYRGSNYSAGEIGYMVTDRQSASSYKPSVKGYGFLESISGGNSIGENLSRRLKREITSSEAFELYRKGNTAAIEVVSVAIENLSFGIANYVSLFDPEIVILGGGVTESFDVIQPIINDILNRYTPRSCEIVQSAFGKKAGVIGAVALVLNEHGALFTTKERG